MTLQEKQAFYDRLKGQKNIDIAYLKRSARHNGDRFCADCADLVLTTEAQPYCAKHEAQQPTRSTKEQP